MKNIICIPFAFSKGFNSGVNVKKNNIVEVYLKNAVVALLSAKWENPECEVVFATNVPVDEIPSQYTNQLIENEITILEIDFKDYRFPKDYKWSLAFYKLCVLKEMLNKGFDNICYLDTDVYIQSKFDSVWKECEYRILLYDINHGYDVREYKEMLTEVYQFVGKETMLTHYGGEFFASNYENAKKFETTMFTIYQEMLRSGFATTKGDEFIISIAAEQMKHIIKNASPYIGRFWTGVRFRLVSTCYRYNPVAVLHMPAEKERGIIKLYDRYVSRNKKPSKQKVWKICRLYRSGLIESVFAKIRYYVKV